MISCLPCLRTSATHPRRCRRARQGRHGGVGKGPNDAPQQRADQIRDDKGDPVHRAAKDGRHQVRPEGASGIQRPAGGRSQEHDEHGQGQADGERRPADYRARIHGSRHNRQHQDGGAQSLDDQTLPDAGARRQHRGTHAGNLGPERAIDDQDGERPDDCPNELTDQVAWHTCPGEVARGGKADRDRWIVVAAGDLARDADANEERQPQPEGREQHANHGGGAEV